MKYSGFEYFYKNIKYFTFKTITVFLTLNITTVRIELIHSRLSISIHSPFSLSIKYKLEWYIVPLMHKDRGNNESGQPAAP
jgi:hypothetical protein